MGTRIQRIAADALDIQRGPRAMGLLGAAAVLFGWALLMAWRGADSRDGLALWVSGLVVVPWVAVRLWRGSRRERHVLVRGNGRLTLYPLLKRPRGYAVALWGMEVDGRPVELELGLHRTLMDASRAAGELEEFLELAKAAPERAR
jgi:hypothetical protein